MLQVPVEKISPLTILAAKISAYMQKTAQSNEILIALLYKNLLEKKR